MPRLSTPLAQPLQFGFGLARAPEIFPAPAVVELEPFEKAGRIVALDQEEPTKAGEFLW